MVVDLARWLGEQLDEDERIAKAADADLSHLTGWIEVEYPETKADEAHALRHHPARVLREIDAKRQIIAAHASINASNLGSDCGTCVWPGTVMAAPWPCLTLRLLALPYADRPGYQEAWRP